MMLLHEHAVNKKKKNLQNMQPKINKLTAWDDQRKKDSIDDD
jgi:hypothetical protein